MKGCGGSYSPLFFIQNPLALRFLHSWHACVHCTGYAWCVVCNAHIMYRDHTSGVSEYKGIVRGLLWKTQAHHLMPCISSIFQMRYASLLLSQYLDTVKDRDPTPTLDIDQTAASHWCLSACLDKGNGKIQIVNPWNADMPWNAEKKCLSLMSFHQALQWILGKNIIRSLMHPDNLRGQRQGPGQMKHPHAGPNSGTPTQTLCFYNNQMNKMNKMNKIQAHPSKQSSLWFDTDHSWDLVWSGALPTSCVISAEVSSATAMKSDAQSACRSCRGNMET